MARRIFGHVFPNAVQVVPTPPHECLKLAGDQRKQFKKLIGRLDCRVHDDFAIQRHASSLSEEREREARGQPEAFWLVTSAMLKAQLELGREFAAGGEIREIG